MSECRTCGAPWTTYNENEIVPSGIPAWVNSNLAGNCSSCALLGLINAAMEIEAKHEDFLLHAVLVERKECIRIAASAPSGKIAASLIKKRGG